MKRRIHQNQQCKQAVFLILCIMMLYGAAQSQNQDQWKMDGTQIVAEAFAFKSDSSGRGRLDIYVQVPYADINFIKEEEQYAGRYTVSATLSTKDKQELWQKSQLVELRLKDFTQTVSRNHTSLKRFSLEYVPGQFELLIQVQDLESKTTTTISRSVVIKDFSSDTLALSDIMLVSRADIEGHRKNIVPNLTGTITKESNGFSLFFEIYNRNPMDSVQLRSELINSKQEIVLQRTKTEVLVGGHNQILWKLDTLAVSADRYTLHIEAEKLPRDTTRAPIRATSNRSLFIRLRDLPMSIANIDKAIDQLIYIGKGSELDYIREATTIEEKQKRFLEFWATHDPDPATTRNELMEEYYARVDYANKNFSHFMEGWKSDRGMVYIRFGPPQNIDRHPFDSDSKPYEIWYYYDENREFIFVDDSGFGDYRLRYPTTDLWGRIR